MKPRQVFGGITLALALVTSACASDDLAVGAAETSEIEAANDAAGSEEPAAPVDVEVPTPQRGTAVDYGEPPAFLEGELSAELVATLDDVYGSANPEAIFSGFGQDRLEPIRESGDVRLAWLMSDTMRFADLGLRERTRSIASDLMGVDVSQSDPWNDLTNRLIAWDVPAPPGYSEYKGNIFTALQPEWAAFFGEDTAVDYRYLSWGGVRIDQRPFGETDQQCNCIPAADNPTVTGVEEATWIDDDDVVFGIELNGETRAYPRQIMEVREMVNDTLGGRDIGMPYCTLCGAAQAYFTDQLPEGIERPVLRTSGLLSRSNKFMYDLTTFSAIDTFTGEAIAGPLFEKGFVLEQASVVTTTWKQWREAFPETTVLTEDLALGRDFDFRNNRDADGPIFPVGDVDPRFEIQADVLGVIDADGQPVAFHVESAIEVLEQGGAVSFEGIEVELAGGGIRAVDSNGEDLGTHQAFWFAWSQFHPETVVWPAS